MIDRMEETIVDISVHKFINATTLICTAISTKVKGTKSVAIYRHVFVPIYRQLPIDGNWLTSKKRYTNGTNLYPYIDIYSKIRNILRFVPRLNFQVQNIFYCFYCFWFCLMDRDVTVTDNNIDVITCEVYILPKINLFLTLILIPSPEDRLKNFLKLKTLIS